MNYIFGVFGFFNLISILYYNLIVFYIYSNEIKNVGKVNEFHWRLKTALS